MNVNTNAKARPIYKKYPLSRIVSVHEIVSADYVKGDHLTGLTHVHQEAWELCFCLEGEVCCILEGREFRLRTGQVIFTPPGTPHDSRITDPKTESFFISFTCSDTYIQILRRRVVRITRDQERLLERLVEELQSAFEAQGEGLRIWNFVPDQHCPLGAEQMICCCLEQLLIGILRDLTMRNGRTATGRDFAQALETDLATRINRYIDRHLHENITVERLCGEFHYRRTKISTVYKKVTGMGINAYITRQRLERARELLGRGTYTVTQVAEQVGFATPQYFSRKFQQANGCTPSEYARRCREES